MNRKNRIVLSILLASLLGVIGWVVWHEAASPTKIGLFNYQPYQASNISLSNKDDFIKYGIIEKEQLHKLKDYDFVLGNGMGLRITEEERAKIQKAMDKRTLFAMFSVTNPANDLSNLDSLTHRRIAEYLRNGNKANYQNMARYIRKHIDKKSLFVTAPDSVSEHVKNAYFYVDENVSFEKKEDFETYLRNLGIYKEGGKKVAVVAGIHDPFSGNKQHIDSLIVSLQHSGLNVYPLISNEKRLEFLEEIQPDAVVYFPTGRLVFRQPDRAVTWLKKHNIPLFTPLTLLQLRENWLKDPMGMMGGFLGQTVVIPELDGALYPYALFAQEKDKDGLYRYEAVPERLQNFTDIINRILSLKDKPNADKKLALYYFKGAGQSNLTAQGLEVVPSLYNLLKRLKAEGYTVENLPETEAEFESLIQREGSVLSTYAQGELNNYLENGHPEWISKEVYEEWVERSLPADLYRQVTDRYGEAPGTYMSAYKDGKARLAVARLDFGNIVLLPQPAAALETGEDDFKVAHGVDAAPPHTYIGSYLWTQYGFKADAIIHFGTHGSLEFTPKKQVALSPYDWPDRMIGNLPHYYYYTIANVGESMMAKRRTYATSISYLSPAFSETQMRGTFENLMVEIREYYKAQDHTTREKVALTVKKTAVEMGLHRDLRLDSLLTTAYTEEDIEKIENFAEEIATEKINGEFYTTGEVFTPEKIRSTVEAMSIDPIAYSLAALDKQSGKVTEKQVQRRVFFTEHYLDPARRIVNQVLDGLPVNDDLIEQVSGLPQEDIAWARDVLGDPFQRLLDASVEKDTLLLKDPGKVADSPSKPTLTKSSSTKDTVKIDGKTGATEVPKALKGMVERAKKRRAQKEKGKNLPASTAARDVETSSDSPSIPEWSMEERQEATAIIEIEQSLKNILHYKKALEDSPEAEFTALLNALDGGYTSPSSGGDAVANPASVPTGRNMFSINAENTPSKAAWDQGVKLVNQTLERYQKDHDGVYPRKVSYTFWSGEFIESKGTSLAQVFYMLGVEPIWDTYGRVSDIRLIPSEELGRPRIDVVVQTSGQFRDLGASRLVLISKAVQMAAKANQDHYENQVANSTTEVERDLVDLGMSPKAAREAATQRIFGGLNGMYGTGIQEVIKASDRWEDESEIAEAYLNNMGAVYGSEKDWGDFNENLLKTVLKNTDAIIQPRQNNTWGALSLDHVYEFMGGMNLTIRNVTGKDPDAYLADYRNRNHYRMQELKEAIGVEARATVLNPTYVKEVMKGKASSAGQITEVVTNTFGWNVTKPDVIDKALWDGLYQMYVEDIYQLGIEDYFKKANPAALQEISAVMLESSRKGLWKASEGQLQRLTELHVDLVREFGSAGSGFSGGNEKLQEMIAQRADPEKAETYKKGLAQMKTQSQILEGEAKEGNRLTKETREWGEETEQTKLSGLWISIIVLGAFLGLFVLLRYQRKKNS